MTPTKERTMDFRFNDEQRIWHETVHTFMEKEVGREYTREHDASREFPWEVYRKMGQQGWLGLLLPEADGGGGERGGRRGRGRSRGLVGRGRRDRGRARPSRRGRSTDAPRPPR